MSDNCNKEDNVICFLDIRIFVMLGKLCGFFRCGKLFVLWVCVFEKKIIFCIDCSLYVSFFEICCNCLLEFL